MQLKKHIPEILIIILISFQTLYYCLASLFASYTFLYALGFITGFIAFLYYFVKKPMPFLLIFISIFIIIIYSSFINPLFVENYLTFDGYESFFKSKLMILFFLDFPILLLFLVKKIDFVFLLKVCCRIALLFLILLFIVNYKFIFLSSEKYDYMTISYLITFWTIIFSMREKNKLLKIVTILISSFFIVFGGSRGSLLCFLTYFFLVGIYKLFENKNKYKIAIIISIIIIFLILSLNLENISRYLNQLLISKGYSSRILMNFLSGDIMHINDRKDIIYTLTNHIFDYPFGYGIFGDRLLVNSYAHNIFIEILIDFGFFVGGLIIVYIFYILIGSFIICRRNQPLYIVHLFFLSISILLIKFNLSGSYLESNEIYFVLGVVLNIKRFWKSEKNPSIIYCASN